MLKRFGVQSHSLSGGGTPIVVLRGNSGVALASALNWYLKYDGYYSVGWGRNGTGNHLPASPVLLPAPTARRIVSPAKYRHGPQVCTYGYSYVWYSFEQWQAEIDRWAMWGINLPLGMCRVSLVCCVVIFMFLLLSSRCNACSHLTRQTSVGNYVVCKERASCFS